MNKKWIIPASFLFLSILIPLTDLDAGHTKSSLPHLSDGTVDPLVGNIDTLFNFTVLYKTEDNVPPDNISVIIDGVPYPMEQVTETSDYTSEVIFNFESYVPVGYHSYRFFTSSNNLSAYYPNQGNYSFMVKGEGPELLDHSFLPTEPTEASEITFNVIYRDLNGYEPEKVELIFIENERNLSYEMNVSSGDVKTGVMCWTSVNLSQGDYSYKIIAVNANNETVSSPAQDHIVYGMRVSRDNGSGEPPTLTNNTVSPQEPTDEDLIFFNVTYTDNSTELIPSVRVQIIKQYPDDFNRTLDLKTADSYPPRYGLKYSGSTRLVPGIYYYRYIAINPEHKVYLPSLDKYPVFTLMVKNTSSNFPILYGPSRDRESPHQGENVTFSIQYRDPKGGVEEPLISILTKRENGTVMRHWMSTTGTNYTLGVTFSESLNLSHGNYSYWFQCKVYNRTFQYPSEGTLIVDVKPPEFDKPPILMTGSHSVKKKNNVSFFVTYIDLDGDPPSYVNLNIASMIDNETPDNSDIITYKMNISGSSYDTGVTAYFDIHLENGSYFYYFETHSLGTHGSGSAKYPNGTYLNLDLPDSPPPKDTPPVLFAPMVHPSVPVVESPVNFTVYYLDIDNDAPDNVTLVLDSKHYELILTGSSFSKGVICYRNLNLSQGEHSFFYLATSRGKTVRYPSENEFEVFVSQDDGVKNRSVSGKASFTIDPATGKLKMNIIDLGGGLYFVFQGERDGWISISMRSEEMINRIISFELDNNMIDDDFRVIIDGYNLPIVSLEELLSSSLDSPSYTVTTYENSTTLYLFIPNASEHSIMISIQNENHDGKVFNTLTILIVLTLFTLVLITGVFLLTKGQLKKKKEAFYRDFDLEIVEEDEEVHSGDLLGDWDDLLE